MALTHYNCLIIDDEKVLADSTAEYFNFFGISTSAVYSCEACRRFFDENTADLILLDINLEDGNGFDICKLLRATNDIPILFISARKSDDDQLIALSIGGDDYIQKPYSLGVLLAKVKAVLKRCKKSDQGLFSDGHLSVDPIKREVTLDGRAIKLTAQEFRLLSYLVQHRDRAIAKDEIFAEVWEDRFTGDGTLNVHIRKLREAIESDPNDPQYIQTIWGVGYRFVSQKR